MLIVLDFYCSDCNEVTERLIDKSEVYDQECLICRNPVTQQVGNPVGYVKGTETPVKQGLKKDLKKD